MGLLVDVQQQGLLTCTAMAAFASKTRTLLRTNPILLNQKATFISLNGKNSKKAAWILGALATVGGGAAVATALAQPVFASDLRCTNVQESCQTTSLAHMITSRKLVWPTMVPYPQI